MKILPCTLAAVLIASAACAPARTGASTGPGNTQPLITADEVALHNTTVEQLIQRKVPGITVTRVGGDIGILIRGATGYDETDRPPLYVLNGSPFRPGPGGALTGVDPYEILSIRVLKGGDAALYGIDAANGVIEIRTKGAGSRMP